jgi:hypothetical protein
MNKLLLIAMMTSSLCMAGGAIRPQLRAVVWMAWAMDMDNPQPEKEQKQQYSRARQRPDNYNNHHCARKQHNARIHQPRSSNYAAKNER